MSGEKFAIALRSTAIPPHTIVELARILDGVKSLSHMFIPEGSQGGFKSLDISSACLGVSKRLRIGSGVIRILEHDPDVLAGRLLTLQELSDNRFVLGIGTGQPSSDPSSTIQAMLGRLDSTRRGFERLAPGIGNLTVPETFIATLRKGIAKAVAGHSDGILLNFCPPGHARDLIKSLDSKGSSPPTIACYLKVFYSRDDERAKRMLLREFSNYNHNSNYHNMFESLGLSQEIDAASSALTFNKEVYVSEKFSRISLANPSKGELAGFVGRFREVGVGLPCLYPYFENEEAESFKIGKVQEMVNL